MAIAMRSCAWSVRWFPDAFAFAVLAVAVVTIAAVESECQARSATRPDAETKRMGVSVFSWEED